MRKGLWVTMKDGSYKNCYVTLVYQWIKIEGDTNEDMGIIVIQQKEPKNSHPFTEKISLSKLIFMAFRK